MFGYETSKTQQINKLRGQLNELNHKINGGFFGHGIDSTIKTLEESVDNLRKRMSVLEEIVRESGLITDFDADEVKIREDRSRDMFGGIHSKSVAYQINQVKVL